FSSTQICTGTRLPCRRSTVMARLYTRLDELRQRLDERRLGVQRRRALEVEPELLRLAAKQEIDLVERLDVVGDERDRDREDVLASGLGEQLERVLRRRLEPARAAGAALERQAPRMLAAEPLEHAGDGALEIGHVRLAALADERLGQPVRREQELD